MPKKGEGPQTGAVDEATIRKFEDDRLALVSMGLNIDDLGQVRNVLQNLKRLKFDTKLTVSILKGFQDLQSKIALLEAEEGEESAKLEALHKGVKAVDSDLHLKEELVAQVRGIQEAGLTVEMVQAVRKLAVDLGAKHGLRAEDALAKFRKEVLKDYDLLLGLEPKVESTKQELGRSKGELTEEQRKLDEARKALGSLGSVVKSYSSLQDQGVRDEVIISLDEAMAKTGLKTKEIENELIKYKSLSRSIGTLEKEIEGLKEKSSQLYSKYESDQRELERQLALRKKEVEKAEADSREAVSRVALANSLTADFDSVKDGVDKMKGDSTSLELQIGQQRVELEAVLQRIAEANGIEADLESIRREKGRQKAELEFFTKEDERFDGDWQERLKRYQGQVTALQLERAKLVGTWESLKEVVQKEMRNTKFLLCFERLSGEKSMGELAPDAAVLALQTALEGFSRYLVLHQQEGWPTPELVDLSSKLAKELGVAYPKVSVK
jgi:hypothetical protein